MKVKAKFTFLGTGGSMGVPVIGCHCGVCRSPSAYNKRLRPSALITLGKRNILIDAGPDLRQQALKYNVGAVDGVIFTHAHHDHTAGIDDLRAYYMRTKKPIHCLLSHETAEEIKVRYSYIFEENTQAYRLVSKVVLQELESIRGEASFLGCLLHYFTFEQAGMPVNGFRIGNLSFVSDIRNYREEIFQDLEGTDILVLSALRHGPSAFHFSIDEAIAFSNKIVPKHTWLTHIAHEVDHEKTNECLPSNIRLAYDGLDFDFEAEEIN